MRAFVVAAALAALAPAAHADSFEAKAQGAQRLNRIEDLVWAFAAPCDAGDDTERRQCRLVRDARAEAFEHEALVVEGDASAFEVRAWDAARKSSRLTLAGCVRCTGIDVDGKTWFLVATTGAARFEGGRAAGGYLYDNARQFADAQQAERWKLSVAHARVELVVRLAPKPRLAVDGHDALAFEVIAYRVIVPCDGSVIAANPESAPVAADPKQCPAPDAVPGHEPPVDVLTSAMIEDAMHPVYAAARACAAEHKLSGKVRLHVTVRQDGLVAKLEQSGDLDGTAVAACIDKAAKQTHFPRTTQRETSFNYPMMLP